jgi:uncharacterized membrane protein
VSTSSPTPPPFEEKPFRRWIGRSLRPLLAGSLALFPLATTIVVVVWLAELAQEMLGPGSRVGRVLRDVGLNFVTAEWAAYLIGLGLTLLLVYVLGLVVESSLQSGWYSVTDRLMRRLPFVRAIYDTARRFARVLEPRAESDVRGMTPVICRFGGPGGSVILGLMPSPDRIQFGDVDYLAVMIPSAPVPIGGLLVYVPADWVEPAGFSVDGLINIYVSMGVTSADFFDDARRGPPPGGRGDGSRADHAQADERRETDVP